MHFDIRRNRKNLTGAKNQLPNELQKHDSRRYTSLFKTLASIF